MHPGGEGIKEEGYFPFFLFFFLFQQHGGGISRRAANDIHTLSQEISSFARDVRAFDRANE